MSTATDGRRIEWAVRDDLEAHGYIVVRAAASKGAADLIALAVRTIVLVQVKRTNPLLRPAERAALIGICDRIGPDIAVPVVAIKPLRKPIAYRLLTGPGARDWLPWFPFDRPTT